MQKFARLYGYCECNSIAELFSGVIVYAVFITLLIGILENPACISYDTTKNVTFCRIDLV